MALGEIMAKGLVVIKGDTSHARAEIAKLSAEEQKAAKARIKAQEEHNATLERSNQRFQLYAAGAVAGWAIISKSVKTYEEHLKSLGSKGESELKRLQGATGALADSQKNLEISIGKVAAAAAPAAHALAQMVDEIANIVDGVGSLINAIGSGIGSSGVSLLSFAMKYGGPVNQARALGSYAVSQARGALGGTNSGVNRWLQMRELNAFEAEMREMELSNAGGLTDDQQRQREIERWAEREKLKERRRQQEQARRRRGGSRAAGGDPYAAASADIFGQIGATSGYSSGRYSQGDLDAIGLGSEPVGPSMGWQGIEVPKSALEDLARLQAELVGEQRQSMLQRIFGDVSEFDAYATAWGGLESVVTAGLDAWISGSQSAGEAMKQALHGFAKQLAGEALLQALRHGAYALGSLAFGDVRSAGQHGIAAAKWGAVAVAAGVVGKVTAPSQGASAGGNAYAAAGIGGGPRASGPAGQHTTIIIGDPLGYESQRSQAQRVRRGLDLAEERTRSSRSVAYS